MSDINIRFDGLILLIALGVGAAAYLLIAIVALMVALVRSHARAWRVSGFAAVMTVGTLTMIAAFFAHWDRGVPGPWVDQLAWPWAIAFLGSCWFLARVR